MYFMKHTIKGIDLNIIEYTVQTNMRPENAEYSPLFLSFSSVYQKPVVSCSLLSMRSLITTTRAQNSASKLR
jgi:hypothetical protein